jgi:hypothetical protein
MKPFERRIHEMSTLKDPVKHNDDNKICEHDYAAKFEKSASNLELITEDEVFQTIVCSMLNVKITKSFFYCLLSFLFLLIYHSAVVIINHSSADKLVGGVIP